MFSVENAQPDRRKEGQTDRQTCFYLATHVQVDVSHARCHRHFSFGNFDGYIENFSDCSTLMNLWYFTSEMLVFLNTYSPNLLHLSSRKCQLYA